MFLTVKNAALLKEGNKKKPIEIILNTFLFIFLKTVDLERAYVFIYVISL